MSRERTYIVPKHPMFGSFFRTFSSASHVGSHAHVIYLCCLGVIDYGCAKLFYIDMAEYGKGANLGCSAILMAIVQHVQIIGFLPPRLNIQSDNTSADYKNSVTFYTLGYLVSRGVFEEVRTSYVTRQ